MKFNYILCVICGEVVNKPQVNQKTCGSRECRRQYERFRIDCLRNRRKYKPKRSLKKHGV